MAEYKFTNKTVWDLSEIWDFTFEIGLEKQANKYFDSLISNYQ